MAGNRPPGIRHRPVTALTDLAVRRGRRQVFVTVLRSKRLGKGK